jgi:hypothetical protein
VSVADRWAKGCEPRFDIDNRLGLAGEKKVVLLIEALGDRRREAGR